jgi:hypothetical protein
MSSDEQSSSGIESAYLRATNRLCKWRAVLVGWMIGTKNQDEPGVKAHRDRADALLMLRVEVNALTALLIQKGLFTREEFMAQIVEECGHKERELEAMFPGYRTTDVGLSIDPTVAAQTNQRLGFPL